MTNDRWKIFEVQEAWFASLDGQRDDEVGAAVAGALDSLSLNTQRRAAKFIERYLNFKLTSKSDPDANLFLGVAASRRLIKAFLQYLGYRVVPSSRADGSYLVRPDKMKSISSASVGLNALGRVFRHMRFIGLREGFDPTRVDDFETWDPGQKLAMAELIFGHRQRRRQRDYVGSFFVCQYPTAPALRMDDAAGLSRRVLQAGAAAGWPRAIYDMVLIIGDDGPRFADTNVLTAEDWAKGSEPPAFGQLIWAPNKGSKGLREKKTAITNRTKLQLAESFDLDPSRPDMAEMQALLDAQDFDALRNIYLFPSSRGTPYSYSCFNNYYFRPAMEEGKVLLKTAKGLLRPTVHRLRSGRIQEEADRIFRDCKSEEEILLNVERLKRDVHLKSHAIWRYIGPAKEKRAAAGKIERLENRLAGRPIRMDTKDRSADVDPVADRVAAHR